MARSFGTVPQTRDAALRTQHALTGEEIQRLVHRVPVPQQPLFEAWRRRERTLDGDPIDEEANQ